MRNLSFINMSYSLLQCQQVPSVLNFTLCVLWKLYFFNQFGIFCLSVLINVSLFLCYETKEWKPDLALTGKWQICLFGFRTRQGKIAENQPCVMGGEPWVDVRSPAAWGGFAQAAESRSFLELGRDAGMEHVCRLCAASPAPSREASRGAGAKESDP